MLLLGGKTRMAVKNLFIKPQHGVALRVVNSIAVTETGIGGNVSCAPFRQVLISSEAVTAECGLLPGDLRENIVVDFDGLYDLPSGAVVEIGDVSIRLTFHCEPCKTILQLVEFERIVHRRGVFGTCLNSGTISLGDPFRVTDRQYEAIPYAIGERIRWYLQRHGVMAAAVNLVHELGLPASSAKAMPQILRKLVLSGSGQRA